MFFDRIEHWAPGWIPDEDAGIGAGGFWAAGDAFDETVSTGGTAPTLSALTASLITSTGCRATVQVAR